MSPLLPKIKACIFDMDGLLLNTEDLITTCRNDILATYSRPPLPWSIKARLQGRSAEDSGAIFVDWAKLPISVSEFQRQFGEAKERLFPTAELLPGVYDLLAGLERRRMPMALATSSRRAEFELKTLGKWNSWFDTYFVDELRVLGDDVRVKKHKPNPDVFLCAARCVNEKIMKEGSGDGVIEAGECLVFEDSIQGVEAGLKAGMHVVWCPHPGLLDALVEGEVDGEVEMDVCRVFGLEMEWCGVLSSRQEFKKRIEEATKGWVKLVFSLESFPYRDYGL